MATDLFGRGMDVEKVNIVINYDMPEEFLSIPFRNLEIVGDVMLFQVSGQPPGP